jgi:undecaprenyl-diphosphatase
MDLDVFYLINHLWARAWMDPLMAAASSWDFWWPFLLAGGLAIGVLGGFHARMMILSAGLAVGVTDGIVVHSLKDLVGRPRPYMVLPGTRMIDLANATPRFLALGKPLKEKRSKPSMFSARGNSFPSGHAANCFALATVVAVFFRRWGWLAYLPAAAVAYSRVYVGSHWPTDVLAACLLGSVIALLVAAGLEAFWGRCGARLFLSLHLAHPSLIRS